jgi:hypothetical protein
MLCQFAPDAVVFVAQVGSGFGKVDGLFVRHVRERGWSGWRSLQQEESFLDIPDKVFKLVPISSVTLRAGFMVEFPYAA